MPAPNAKPLLQAVSQEAPVEGAAPASHHRWRCGVLHRHSDCRRRLQLDGDCRRRLQLDGDWRCRLRCLRRRRRVGRQRQELGQLRRVWLLITATNCRTALADLAVGHADHVRVPVGSALPMLCAVGR